MRLLKIFTFLPVFFILSEIGTLYAQNPLIKHMFTADPSARVFKKRVYVFPSHDIPCGDGQGFIGFCMADYHVFSSEDLSNWTDHGIILKQNDVAWVDSTTYSMWAPDCISRNGKYYFYFPAVSNENPRKRRIGVAVSDNPEGPYMPQPSFIKNVEGIDPNVFIDRDGKAYLYWSGFRSIRVARLNKNMLELDSGPQIIEGLPEKFKEGPYLFERKGVYYMTFPYVPEKSERLEYTIADNPMGPFHYGGVIMDESPTGCWTNHHSVIEYKGQWYLFYHHNDLSPNFDKNRSIRVDSLFFNADGTIRKVTPSLRGVGISPANQKIQVDRYSSISNEGAAIDYLDSLNRQMGWKIVFTQPNAWVGYNCVDFGKKSISEVNVMLKSLSEGNLEIRLDHVNGALLASIYLEPDSGWGIVSAEMEQIISGIHNIYIVPDRAEYPVEVDWIQFE